MRGCLFVFTGFDLSYLFLYMLTRIYISVYIKFMSLESGAFQELDEWFHSFSILWEERLDNLEEYMLDYKTKKEDL